MAATEQDECESWGEASGSAVVAEWTALRDRFGALSRRLLDAAKANPETRREQLVHELAECRLGFRRLCDEARAWAEAFQVPCPPDGQLENLLGIGAFLDQVGEAVLNHERTDRPRRRALLVLHQVLRLAHTTGPEFAPLAACQDTARALFWQFETGIGADAAELRPFYDLLVLAHQRHTLSDEAWLHVYQSVSTSFGKALAAAATRGNLVPSLAVLEPGAGDAAVTALAAFLDPAFARPDDEYEVALQAFELMPAPAGPAVIGGPLSVASDELGAKRVAPAHLAASLVRFRTADGKLYTLMPAEPVAKDGPRSAALRERTPVAR